MRTIVLNGVEMNPNLLLWNIKQDQAMISHDLLAKTIDFVRNEERMFIGQELHDNVNQILMSAKLFVEMLHPDGGQQQQLKTKTIEYILMAIREIRGISHELVNQKQDFSSLLDRLKHLIEDLQLTTPIRFEMEFDKKIESLPDNCKMELFRIIQEQIKNIILHARATEVSIRLEKNAGEINLEIRDNGVGFDSTQKKSGVGLSSIFQRAAALKGKANIRSSNGNGCTLFVVVPAA